jgi:hypothetical protein
VGRGATHQLAAHVGRTTPLVKPRISGVASARLGPVSADGFPLELDDFLYATARILALAGMREEVRLLAAQEQLAPQCIDYDRWDGGQWSWRFDLKLALMAYRALESADREIMESRIKDAMREVIRANDAHSVVSVRIVMDIPKANPTWRADAQAWATGQGLTNQGRARSTNIAPFEHDGLLFRSRPEILLYAALKATGITIAPLPVFIRGGAEYRRLEPDFVLIHRGVMMVVEVDGDAFHPEAPMEAHRRLSVLSHEGVHTERVAAAECATESGAKTCATHLIKLLERLATNR